MPDLRTNTTSPAPGRISKSSRSHHQRRGSISSTASRSSSISSTPSRPTSPFTRQSIMPLTPDTSRPCSPLNGIRQTSTSSRRQNSSKASFVAFVGRPQTPGSITGDAMVVTQEPESLALAMDSEPPTVTWECATAVVSSQKVHTTYEKPTYTPGTRFDADGEPIPGTGHVLQYGKMLTKTVTMTVTTTIASTEILHPGEEGYDASRKRQRSQQRQGQEDTPMENLDGQSDVEHETFHESHHNAARPAPPPNNN